MKSSLGRFRSTARWRAGSQPVLVAVTGSVVHGAAGSSDALINIEGGEVRKQRKYATRRCAGGARVPRGAVPAAGRARGAAPGGRGGLAPTSWRCGSAVLSCSPRSVPAEAARATGPGRPAPWRGSAASRGRFAMKVNRVGRVERFPRARRAPATATGASPRPQPLTCLPGPGSARCARRRRGCPGPTGGGAEPLPEFIGFVARCQRTRTSRTSHERHARASHGLAPARAPLLPRPAAGLRFWLRRGRRRAAGARRAAAPAAARHSPRSSRRGPGHSLVYCKPVLRAR